MCRLYNKDGDPSYVRLCYRTGEAGRRVPWDDAGHCVDYGFGEGLPGCVSVYQLTRRLESRGLTADGRRLHLRVPLRDSAVLDSILREVLRWQLDGTRRGYDAETRTLTLERDEPWIDTSEVLKRAASFGWVPAPPSPSTTSGATRWPMTGKG